MIQLASFIVDPSLIDAIPPEYRDVYLAQLNAPTIIVLAPILERVLTLFAHTFAALLVFTAVTRGRKQLFLYAIIFKSALDSAAPYLQQVLASSSSPMMVYAAEMWVVLFGAIGLLGTIRMRRGT